MSGECQTKNRSDADDKKDEKPIKALDEGDSVLFHASFALLTSS